MTLIINNNSTWINTFTRVVKSRLSTWPIMDKGFLGNHLFLIKIVMDVGGACTDKDGRITLIPFAI